MEEIVNTVFEKFSYQIENVSIHVETFPSLFLFLSFFFFFFFSHSFDRLMFFSWNNLIPTLLSLTHTHVSSRMRGFIAYSRDVTRHENFYVYSKVQLRKLFYGNRGPLVTACGINVDTVRQQLENI